MLKNSNSSNLAVLEDFCCALEASSAYDVGVDLRMACCSAVVRNIKSLLVDPLKILSKAFTVQSISSIQFAI